jgi:hypothetical protein
MVLARARSLLFRRRSREEKKTRTGAGGTGALVLGWREERKPEPRGRAAAGTVAEVKRRPGARQRGTSVGGGGDVERARGREERRDGASARLL